MSPGSLTEKGEARALTMMDPQPHAENALGVKPVENAIYNLHGRLHIYVQDYLFPVFNAVTDTRSNWTDQAEMVAQPGTELWVEKMVEFRNNLASDLRNARADVQQQKTFIRNLGEAILEIADEKNWCEEYDEFAERWGLPTRLREYEVTVQLSVLARSKEEASECVTIEVPDEHQGSEYPDFVVREYN